MDIAVKDTDGKLIISPNITIKDRVGNEVEVLGFINYIGVSSFPCYDVLNNGTNISYTPYTKSQSQRRAVKQKTTLFVLAKKAYKKG